MSRNEYCRVAARDICVSWRALILGFDIIDSAHAFKLKQIFMRTDRHDLTEGCGRLSFDARNLFTVTYARTYDRVLGLGIIFY